MGWIWWSTLSLRSCLALCAQCKRAAWYNYNILFSRNRDFCVILTDDVNATTTECLTLLFIGFNDDAPVITYTSEGVVSFTEGQAEFVPIINGSITITDQDHPTRYIISYRGGDSRLELGGGGLQSWDVISEQSSHLAKSWKLVKKIILFPLSFEHGNVCVIAEAQLSLCMYAKTWY